jgi:5'(3')-deoxyribonucleotidase
MSKVTVAFDIDGVLARFGKAYVQTVNGIFPEKNLPEDYQPSTWFYEDVLTHEEMTTAWDAAINTPYFWRRLASYEDNVKALISFLHTFHSEFVVYYITSRVDTPGKSAFAQTSEWLISRDLMMYNTSLLVVPESKEKIPIIKALRIQASVDDYLPTAVAANEIPEHQSFLYDRPWNKADRPEGLKVVLNLQEYLNNLLSLRENN